MNNSLDLLGVPASQLLERYGTAEAFPGSGSAASLSGLLACKLIASVLDASLKKPEISPRHDLIAGLLSRVRHEYEPFFVRSFDQSVAASRELLVKRAELDVTADPKDRRRARDLVSQAQKPVAEVSVGVAEHCADLARLGLKAYDLSHEAYKGDAGAAVSAALAGLSTSLFVCYFSLSKRSGDWATGQRQKCASVASLYSELQVELFNKVIQIKRESDPDYQISMDLLTLPIRRRLSHIRLSIIVAQSENRCIGDHGKLPWHIPDDLKRFKSVTYGKPIIMGRKTFDSLGKALPGRMNIVVTRDPEWTAPGVEVCLSLEDAIQIAEQEADEKGLDEFFVIGGADVYRQALAYANRLYISQIHTVVAGDAFFPKIELGAWHKTQSELVANALGAPNGYTFSVYDSPLR